MSGDPNLVAGVCSGLPLGIQDLMWGTDNERVRNKSDRTDPEKHRADPVRHVSHPGRMPRAIHHRT